MNVKNLIYGLASAWMACAVVALGTEEEWAPVASQVSYSLNHAKKSVSAVTVIGNAEDTGDAEALFKEVKVKPHSEGETATVDGGKASWCVINIPVQVYAVGKERKTRKLAPAHYVRRLHVDVYLLIRKPEKVVKEASERSGSTGKYYLVKKGMDLVDIPMKKTPCKEEQKVLGQATFNIGVFIPRSAAYMLTEDFDDPISALKKPGVVAGYAVEASCNGDKCHEYMPPSKRRLVGSSNPGYTEASIILDSALAKDVGSKRWWEARSKNNLDEPDVDVLCVSETPFAMYYGRYYPRTTPTYGAPEKSDEESATGTDSEEESSSNSGTHESSSSHRGTSRKESNGGKKSDYDSDL